MTRLPFLLSAALLVSCTTLEPVAPGDQGGWRPFERQSTPARRAAPTPEVAADAAGLLRAQDRALIEGADDAVIGALYDALPRARDAAAIGASRRALTAAAEPLGSEPFLGDYRCRVIRHGGPAGVTVYRDWSCVIRIDGDLLVLEKTGGSELMAGTLMVSPSLAADGRTTLLYAGTRRGAGEAPAPYPEGRAEVGLFERFGEQRYRLVLPGTNGGLDVLELRRAA